MEGFWVGLWTVLWFGGLTIFCLLSVMVIIFGGRDLAALLTSLKKRHGQQPEEPPAATES